MRSGAGVDAPAQGDGNSTRQQLDGKSGAKPEPKPLSRPQQSKDDASTQHARVGSPSPSYVHQSPYDSSRHDGANDGGGGARSTTNTSGTSPRRNTHDDDDDEFDNIPMPDASMLDAIPELSTGAPSPADVDEWDLVPMLDLGILDEIPRAQRGTARACLHLSSACARRHAPHAHAARPAQHILG